MRKMNDQFINYEAESAQLADKLSTAKNQIDSLEQEHRELKVCFIPVYFPTLCFQGILLHIHIDNSNKNKS